MRVDRFATTRPTVSLNQTTAGNTSILPFPMPQPGSYEAVECITNLECNADFERAAQACLQGRRTYPPLITDCATLCDALSSCDPDASSALSPMEGVSV